jgi:hypothetical protein
MERWGVGEFVHAVELLIRSGSIAERRRVFRRELNQQDVPSPNSVCRWVRQWREEGSVSCKKPPGQPSSVRTLENIAGVFASVDRSPRRSAPKHAPALGMSDRSLRRIQHTALNLHPYRLQTVRSLSDREKDVRLQIFHQLR